MAFRAYWRAAARCLGIATAIGAFIGVLFFAASNPDYLAYAGLQGVGYWACVGAATGIATGLVATAGIGIRYAARRHDWPIHGTAKWAADAAAMGVLVVYGITGVVMSFVSNAWIVGLTIGLVGLVCAVVSASVVQRMVDRDNLRRRFEGTDAIRAR